MSKTIVLFSTQDKFDSDNDCELNTHKILDVARQIEDSAPHIDLILYQASSEKACEAAWAIVRCFRELNKKIVMRAEPLLDTEACRLINPKFQIMHAVAKAVSTLEAEETVLVVADRMDISIANNHFVGLWPPQQTMASIVKTDEENWQTFGKKTKKSKLYYKTTQRLQPQYG